MKDSNRSNTSAESEWSPIRLANTWVGKTVTISSHGGAISIDTLEESPVPVKASTRTGAKRILLEIERAPLSLGLPGAVAFGAVAFRVVGTIDDRFNHNTIANSNMYLTNIKCSDEARKSTAEALASIPSLLNELIPDILDFCIGRPTRETHFEGAGLNYSPMTIQQGGEGRGHGDTVKGGTRTATGSNCPTTLIQPNKLQVFELTRVTECSRSVRFGVKSIFGTYWRSQH